MDQVLYDEFGNYIGPEISDASDEEEEEGENGNSEEDGEQGLQHGTDERADGDSGVVGGSTSNLVVLSNELVKGVQSQAVVPHEEKTYYPEASEVYPGVEVLVEEEDAQPLTEPIVAPVQTKDFDLVERTLPECSFDFEFVAGLMYKPQLIRQVCFLGDFHAGKTTAVSMLVDETHMPESTANRLRRSSKEPPKPSMFTDSRKDEAERGLSIKATPISLVLSDSSEKSYLVYVFDTPGHVNYEDECTAAIRLCDGAVLVVDALMGVMSYTERLLKQALQERLAVCVLINGIDRLILELRLPPADAYFKLRHTLQELNQISQSHCEMLGLPVEKVLFSPSRGNVAFASALYGFVFTLQSFARIYTEHFYAGADRMELQRGGWMRGTSGTIDVDTFAKCLWGDLYFDADGSRFVPIAPAAKRGSSAPPERSFVEFILTPLYKIFSHTVGEERPTLEPFLEELGVVLDRHSYTLDTRSLLRKVCRGVFGGPSALVEAILRSCPNPAAGAAAKIHHNYSGSLQTPVAKSMLSLDQNSTTLVVHTCKNYHRPDCTAFDVFGRVFAGTIYKGQRVKVLGEAYSWGDDDEDVDVCEVTHLWIYQAGRYRVEVSHVPAGNWVLIGGLSHAISKTGTITNAEVVVGSRGSSAATMQPATEEVDIFHPLRFYTKNVVRVSCEPLNPSELPKMLEGFRKISRSYPLCQTRVEDSGEHILLGSGELYMDCLLHDLRELYSGIELKVADPAVQFCETVTEMSALKCFASTPNKKNELHFIAEPLDRDLAGEIENNIIRWPRAGDTSWTPKHLSERLIEDYNWDTLAARSIWAFGPDTQGPNILEDATLPCDVDKNLLAAAKNFIVQGFRWVTREGPLIEEPIRNCRFRMLEAKISPDPAVRSGGQIIPTARRVAYSAFLLATPRLMEPMLFVEVVCPADCVSAVYTVLSRRRGYVSKDLPKPGTPLYIVHAYIPAIDSFGFETDLRTHTSGQAFCLASFDHWNIVPGDPLDKSVVLRTLEPAPVPHLGREFLLKTRRRKGLSENVNISKFFDDPMFLELARKQADLDQYM